MIEWSETDLLVRDSIREFVDKEIRPCLDALESGALPPYDIIRKLFKAFGLDALARESVSRVCLSRVLHRRRWAGRRRWRWSRSASWPG
ncbi:hypothetical protein QRX60_04765 [Amycolatopsis mongoliensis]|uniref:Acyl-CoA dehydrogenase/oxidase N-terminal domain-containing protein n=1 Tax=Amycolatopsis mongoliensis TaxID=715475 RepID=A0A9Y2JUG6_9PSEU|nr:hypothetical protein [Amycolatopsis sp. 4-36]WIY03184.1 hypothetical protein QRX60_04765 [Amycolatopsis sp. 4-36]